MRMWTMDESAAVSLQAEAAEAGRPIGDALAQSVVRGLEQSTGGVVVQQKVDRAIEATRGVNSVRLVGWLCAADPDLVLRAVEDMKQWDETREL